MRDQGVRQLPRDVFHIADAANWPGILSGGLLCTAEIAARLGRDADVYEKLISFRPKSVEVPKVAYVRDQAPMPPQALRNCLDEGMTPGDWYGRVNGHVFFCLSMERVNRHLRALRKRPQILLTFDGWRLAEAYSETVFVTPFNVGAALRRAAPRGRRTFVPVREWQKRAWTSEAASGCKPRSASHNPAELVVRGSVPDAMNFLKEIQLKAEQPNDEA